MKTVLVIRRFPNSVRFIFKRNQINRCVIWVRRAYNEPVKINYYCTEILGEEYEIHGSSIRSVFGEIRYRKMLRRNPTLVKVVNRLSD